MKTLLFLLLFLPSALAMTTNDDKKEKEDIGSGDDTHIDIHIGRSRNDQPKKNSHDSVKKNINIGIENEHLSIEKKYKKINTQFKVAVVTTVGSIVALVTVILSKRC